MHTRMVKANYYCKCCARSASKKSEFYATKDIAIERSTESKVQAQKDDLLCNACRQKNHKVLAGKSTEGTAHEEEGQGTHAPSQAGNVPSSSKNPYHRRTKPELIQVITEKKAELQEKNAELKTVRAELDGLKANVGKANISMLTRMGQHPLVEALCSCLDKGLLTSANSPR